MRPADLGRKSVRRNSLIADLLHRISFIEKAGTGIKRMREEAREQGCPEPVFTENGFFTVVFFPNPEVRAQVAAPGEGVTPEVTLTPEVTPEVTGEVPGKSPGSTREVPGKYRGSSPIARSHGRGDEAERVATGFETEGRRAFPQDLSTPSPQNRFDRNDSP
jgi:hypothetical protein